MARSSFRRAVFSWILLVMVGAGIAWMTARQEQQQEIRPVPETSLRPM